MLSKTTVTGVARLSCGHANCVYGNPEGAKTSHSGYCRCLPYDRQKDGQPQKIRNAKWAIHHLRKENKRLKQQLDKVSNS